MSRQSVKRFGGRDMSNILIWSIPSRYIHLAGALGNARSETLLEKPSFRNGRWLDMKNIDAEAATQFLKPAPDDYFAFEPTTIERNAPPPKSKAQMSLF